MDRYKFAEGALVAHKRTHEVVRVNICVSSCFVSDDYFEDPTIGNTRNYDDYELATKENIKYFEKYRQVLIELNS